MRPSLPSVHALARLILVLLLARRRLPIARAAHRAAGPPPQPDAAQIALGLRKLGVVGSVLYVAAHPDDENTALLAYLANGALVRTGYLSITRGDGGQNLIGVRAGAGAGPHPHAGAAGRAPHRRRRAVLHPRARLRLLEEPRRDAAHLGQGRRARRRRRGHPPVPPRRDRHALLARARRTRTATTPPRRCWRWRRSAPPPIRSFTPSSSRGGVDALAGAPHLLEPFVVGDQAERRPVRATSSSTSAATTRCSARRTARSPPTAAACTRARASAWRARARRSSSTSSCSPAPTAGSAATKPRAGDPRRRSTLALDAVPGRPRSSTALVAARGRRSFDPARPAGVDPGAGRDRRRARRGARRRLAGREAARGQRADARLRGAVRRGDGAGLPRRARRPPSRSPRPPSRACRRA